MGTLTRILITGANGFVGRACVAEARRRGIEVVAVYRSAPVSDWQNDAGILPVQVDLSSAEAATKIQSNLTGVQAVIHAAAHLGGDAASHKTDTLAGTKNVLSGMQDTGARLVLVSSIAVYDLMQVSRGDAITENTPLESRDTPRDAYAGAKLEQEELCKASGLPVWIMRPGAIYGPGRTWHALLGFWASKLHVQIDSGGELPLTHVTHTAWALVEAATRVPHGATPLNILDDDRPTRSRFLKAHRRLTGWPRATLPIPYRVWEGMIRPLGPLSGKLPGLFQEPVLRARMMPLRWPNTALRGTLGGEDDDTFEAMLGNSVERLP